MPRCSSRKWRASESSLHHFANNHRPRAARGDCCRYQELKNASAKSAHRLEEAATDLEALRGERKALQGRLLEAEEEMAKSQRSQTKILKEFELLRRSRFEAERDAVAAGDLTLRQPDQVRVGDLEPQERPHDPTLGIADVSQDLRAYAEFLGASLGARDTYVCT